MSEKAPRSRPYDWPAEWPVPEVERRGEAAETLSAECSRIIHTQKALIAAGIRTEPDPHQLRRAICFHNVSRFIEACAPHRQQVLDHLKRLRAAKQS